ncbi:ABC transporter family substrate-binding protein [Aeromicrobium terrae]|uniref:ABC transporter family substrate-binding protein n=1 Tax=Aeromicrobium terrae TaxID=2498846 RepID=A0A5C8NFL9_9ACTN|nr:ABC transporter family substrate-binding protein [Aeromicrobium terrae]TXL56566.1 ABC transporter family substrate-binding protein [Aeromicrobium terrae]
MHRLRVVYYMHRTLFRIGFGVLALAVVVAGVLGGRVLLDRMDDGEGGGRVSRALPATAWVKAPPAQVRDGGTLRLAVASLPSNFNPVQADGATPDAATLLGPTTGGAVRITADGGWTVDRDYARSVRVVEEDPLTVEVELNTKAVWEGGSSITAADMVAFWRAMSGQVPGLQVASTDGWDDIESVEPDGDFRYTITFDEQRSDWPKYVYPRLAENVSTSPQLFNEGFRDKAVSSNGPFTVSSIDEKTGTVEETRNPKWWGAKPKLERIVWRIATPQVQAAAFVAGELDVVRVDSSTYRSVTGKGSVQRASGSEWTHLTLNGGRGPLRDVDVRRAVAKALDRPAAAASVGAGVNAPGLPMLSHVLLPVQPGYPEGKAPKPDRKGAEALLLKAGYTFENGKALKKGRPLTLTMPVPSETPTATARARRIVTDLAKIGITVETPTVDGETFFAGTVVPLDFDLVTFTWSGSPFPVETAEPRFRPIDSPQNYTGVTPKSLNPLWSDASEELDREKQAALVKKLDGRLDDAAVVLPLAVVPTVMVVRPGVVNYGAATFEQPDYTRAGFSATRD